MQDLKLLWKRGATPEALKEKLTAKKLDPKLKSLLELHEQRLVRYVSRGFEDAKIYWTLDRTIDASLRNLKFTQAREILASNPSWEKERLAAMFNQWGLHQMLCPMKNADGSLRLGPGNCPLFELNVPIFDTVLVPLVASYRTMRLAKIFNERNTYPLYKYSPSHATTKHLSQCQVITEIMARQSVDMGHSQVLKQCILQMLDYGFALRMPTCAWYREEYQAMDNGKEVTKTQREGMDWGVMRPERTFIDSVNPLYSLNTDTGCKFMGYWDIKRYGELKRDKKLWNTDKINYGSSQAFFGSSAWSVYQELYPCQMKIPQCLKQVDYATIDRQDREFWYSTSAEEDAATIVTVMFDKIIPSEWGLFEYDYPVWTRWLYADTCTPLYCEVLPYTPGAIYLYDYDSNRGFQNSLTMHLSPFQQLFGNYLTQYFLSVKNNLPRIVFYNTDIVNTDHVLRVQAEKNNLYQQLTFLPFSKQEQSYEQQGQQDAFFPVVFPQVNTAEIAASLKLTLELLERMLGFPSQEVGAPASHEQTAREVIIVNDHSNSRTELTADGVDQAEKAVKKANYEAWTQYGSDEVTATIVGVSEESQKALKDMGFTVEPGESNKNNTFGVTGQKSALLLSDFATDQTGTTRSQDPKVAIAMMQSLQVALQNPALFQAVGVDGVVELINEVFIWAGLPEDFRLRVSSDYKPLEEQQKEFLTAVEKAKQEILKASMDQMGESLKNVADGIKSQVIEPTKKAFEGIAQQLQEGQKHDDQQDQILGKIMQAMAGGGNGAAPPQEAVPMGAVPPMEVPGGPVPEPTPLGMAIREKLMQAAAMQSAPPAGIPPGVTPEMVVAAAEAAQHNGGLPPG